MEKNDCIMFHYHTLGIFDDIWQVGNEFIVDNSFNSHYTTLINEFNTGVNCEPDNHRQSFDKVLNYYLKEENLKKLDWYMLRQLLLESRDIIRNVNICNREIALEEYRKRHCSHLPSRFHCIWVTDDISLKFWKEQLRNSKLILFKLSLSGTLFKSSDLFIPDDYLPLEHMYKSSSRYWHPNFEEGESLEQAEYLFQGKVKILQKLD